YVVLNDAGVITERTPDTVRGADFAFYSYAQVPRGAFPKRGYLNVPPDLVVEVRSPDDRWKNILAKVSEYLNIGVHLVCVLDPEPLTATFYEADKPEVTLPADQDLAFPDVLPGLTVTVQRFFE